jgi:predicted nucleotidyltransferase
VSGGVFTVEERERLRDILVAAAEDDPRVAGAALTGSAALGCMDRWSDIDLALRLAAGADEPAVLADWTTRMYEDHDAVHHLDVWRGPTRFRVFLLASSLQVDIAFWAWDAFGATGPAFALLFGTANPVPLPAPPAAAELIGLAWLHALHARSSITRGRVWQAEYMVSGLRDQVLALACLRVGVPAVQGQLQEVAAALAAMTGQPHPLATATAATPRTFGGA